MTLLIGAFASVILATVVVGQGESPACLSALRSLSSTTHCLIAFYKVGNAIDMGTGVPDADISTLCTTTCQTILLGISTECEDYEGAGLIVEIGCISNGVGSCIQLATMSNDESNSSNSSETSTCNDPNNCTACNEIEDLVTYGGCCANEYYYATASNDSFGGFTIDQIYTFCGVTNPGNCTQFIGGGGVKMVKGIDIFTVFIIAAIITIIA